LAGPINLAGAANPYLAFWIRQAYAADARGYYLVQVSNDGGVNWATLVGETYVAGQTGWTRVQASLASYRQPGVVIRIGVRYYNYAGWPNFQIDDVLIDNAPTPRTLALSNPTNNGMKIKWGESTAPDLKRYRVVLSNDANSVNDAWSGSSVSGRTERRAFDVLNKATAETTLTDLAFAGTTYYARVWEEDTQGFVNAGSDRAELATTWSTTSEVAPFVEGFEGSFQWAADYPWRVTTADGAEDGHSPTHGWEDSPVELGVPNYASNTDRRLVAKINFTAVSRPVLRFKHRYSFEWPDQGSIAYSFDGSNFTTLGFFWGNQGPWVTSEFDLGNFRQQPQGYVWFRVTSDGGTERDGWHLDDVEVYNNTRTNAFPFSDDVEVDSLTQRNWIAGNWSTATTTGHSGSRVWSIWAARSDVWNFLTLAGPVNLSGAANPYVAFWIRQAYAGDQRGYYLVRVSSGGGVNWATRGGARRTLDLRWGAGTTVMEF
jgi:hypothetical protein